MNQTSKTGTDDILREGKLVTKLGERVGVGTGHVHNCIVSSESFLVAVSANVQFSDGLHRQCIREEAYILGIEACSCGAARSGAWLCLTRNAIRRRLS